jgi:hypothetical protein
MMKAASGSSFTDLLASKLRGNAPYDGIGFPRSVSDVLNDAGWRGIAFFFGFLLCAMPTENIMRMATKITNLRKLKIVPLPVWTQFIGDEPFPVREC